MNQKAKRKHRLKKLLDQRRRRLGLSHRTGLLGDLSGSGPFVSQKTETGAPVSLERFLGLEGRQSKVTIRLPDGTKLPVLEFKLEVDNTKTFLVKGGKGEIFKANQKRDTPAKPDDYVDPILFAEGIYTDQADYEQAIDDLASRINNGTAIRKGREERTD